MPVIELTDKRPVGDRRFSSLSSRPAGLSSGANPAALFDCTPTSRHRTHKHKQHGQRKRIEPQILKRLRIPPARRTTWPGMLIRRCNLAGAPPDDQSGSAQHLSYWPTLAKIGTQSSATNPRRPPIVTSESACDAIKVNKYTDGAASRLA